MRVAPLAQARQDVATERLPERPPQPLAERIMGRLEREDAEGGEDEAAERKRELARQACGGLVREHVTGWPRRCAAAAIASMGSRSPSVPVPLKTSLESGGTQCIQATPGSGGTARFSRSR
jgi:hypothetical protein